MNLNIFTRYVWVAILMVVTSTLYSCKNDEETIPEDYEIKIISGDNQLVEMGQKSGIIQIQLLHHGKPIPKEEFDRGSGYPKYAITDLELNGCDLNLNDLEVIFTADGIAQIRIIASPSEGLQQFEIILHDGINYAKITSVIIHIQATPPPPNKKVFCMGSCQRIFSDESQRIFLHTTSRNGTYYYSENGGDTWNKTNLPNPSYQFAGGDGKVFFSALGAVLFSTNHGGSYVTYTNQYNYSPVYTAYKNGKLFMSFPDFGVYSANNGQTWDTAFAKKPFSELSYTSNGSYIFISKDSVFLAANETATPAYRYVPGKAQDICKKQNEWYLLTVEKSVYKSSNNGESWQFVADISSQLNTQTPYYSENLRYANGYFYLNRNDQTVVKTNDFVSFTSLGNLDFGPYLIPLEGKNASLYIGRGGILSRLEGF